MKLKKRRVQHYGYEFIYGKNSVNPDNKLESLPEWLEPPLSRMNEVCRSYNGPDSELDQLTINEYHPGQGIPPHVDSHAPFKEAFTVLSLCGGVVMSFKSHKGQSKHLYLPPRSLYVLTGESRYAWFHSISERRSDRVEEQTLFRKRRVSLTFRSINHTPCNCQWPFFCDSKGFE